jgi:hypothetical protein
MPFLTIHELSTQFDTTARVIRYHFHRLRLAGKLAEGADYRRENFVDDQHFEWKINPVPFIRASGLTLSPIAKHTAPLPPDNNLSTKPASVVTQMDNQPAAAVDHSLPKTPQPDNQPPGAVTKPVNQPAPPRAEPGLEREIITLLKEQVKVKDGQIADLTARVREVSETNVKLIGATLQQAREIQDLLRLTGGKSEPDGVVIKHRQPTASAGNSAVTKEGQSVNQPADDGEPLATNFVDQNPAAAGSRDQNGTSAAARAA